MKFRWQSILVPVCKKMRTINEVLRHLGNRFVVFVANLLYGEAWRDGIQTLWAYVKYRFVD